MAINKVELEAMLREHGWDEVGVMEPNCVWAAHYLSGMSISAMLIPGFAGTKDGSVDVRIQGEFEAEIPVEQLPSDMSPRGWWDHLRPMIAADYCDEDVLGAFPEAE